MNESPATARSGIFRVNPPTSQNTQVSGPLPYLRPHTSPPSMANSTAYQRRRSWRTKYAKEKDIPTLLEGQELTLSSSPTSSSPVITAGPPRVGSPAVPASAPGTPKSRHSPLPTRSSSSTSLTDACSSSFLQMLDREASQIILNAFERTNSAQPSQSTPPPKSPEPTARTSGSFGKMAFSSMMGGLSALSLTRTSTANSATASTNGDEKERGRSMESTGKRARSTSEAVNYDLDASRSRSRARSHSPFTLRRFRQRDPSPAPQPLPLADADVPSSSIRPQTAFADDDSEEETLGDMDAESDDDSSDSTDSVTERNTERNAQIVASEGEGGFAGLDCDVDLDPDPLGEGVNVVVPPEPYFFSSSETYQSSGHSSGTASPVKGKKTPRRRKSTRHEPLPLHTSRPIFRRDRCTIILTQGDSEGNLSVGKRRTYVVASDLSEESRYAVEWGIGTVLRDGDEMMIVTIVENESKVDPPIPNAADRALKLRCQQERQGLAYILARQATSLLQRTRLLVKVSCQAWHAKNARHMLLDIVDYHEPTMLIVGSRGHGQLKGILLGSTSHYLIQKCSVPVMVARRRLKRPPRHSAHLSKHRAHVSLAEAGIDRVVARADTKANLDRDESRRTGSASIPEAGEGEAEEEELDDGVKVAE